MLYLGLLPPITLSISNPKYTDLMADHPVAKLFPPVT
jgi:hypothetical protein